MSGRRRALLVVALLAAVAYRENVVSHFSTGSPDGDQYIALARGVRAGTYGFGGLPSYARLPGYPLVLSTIVGDHSSREEVVARAARLNALFDVGTAVGVYLIGELVGAGLLCALLVIIAPPLVLFSTTSLTESLATLLGTWSLVLAAGEGRWRTLACGAVLGAALLVRLDALTFAPGVVILLWRRPMILAVLGLLVVWLPWPLRNVVDFHSPHPTAAEWPAQDGTPLPSGPIRWMRTWSSSAPGEQTFADKIVFAKRCGEGPLPAMTSSDEERNALVEVIARCRAEGLTRSVSDDFDRLAAQRRAAHPLTVFVILPIQRLLRLWLPPPEREVHWMHIPEAGLPSHFALFQAWYAITYVLAALGLVLLGRHPLALAIGAVLVTRSVLHAFAVPHYEGFRYWVEVLPLVCILVGAALAKTWDIILVMRRR